MDEIRKGKRKDAKDLDKVLATHGRGCSIRRWSDLDKRHCSCGVEVAREEVKRLRAIEEMYWRIIFSNASIVLPDLDARQ